MAPEHVHIHLETAGLPQQLHVALRGDKLGKWHRPVHQGVRCVAVPLCPPLLLAGYELRHFYCVGCLLCPLAVSISLLSLLHRGHAVARDYSGMYLEYVSGVQQLGVYMVGRQVPPADHEYFRALQARGLRFGGAHVAEQLLTHPQERRVVTGPKHLRHEPTVRLQEVARQAQCLQTQRHLRQDTILLAA